MTNVEIIKHIKGFEGRYTISNLGIVRSLLTGKEMKPYITSKGYARVNLRYAHSRDYKSFLVHRLVAGNFLPNPNTSFTPVLIPDTIPVNIALTPETTFFILSFTKLNILFGISIELITLLII